MPKRIALPDGSIGEFPDSMDDAAIESVLRKQFAPDESAAESARLGAHPAPPPPQKNVATDALLGVGDFMRGSSNALHRTLRGLSFGHAGAPEQTVREGKQAGDYAGEIATDVGLALAPMGAADKAIRGSKMLSKIPLAAPAADIAANAAYSALTTDKDRGQAAALGAGGAAAGRVLSRTLAGLVKPTDEAQRLLDKGVRLTPGQAGGREGMGAVADTFERTLEGVPGFGSRVAKARTQGLEDWNRSVIRPGDAIDRSASVGREAMAELGDSYRRKYIEVFPEGVPLNFDAEMAGAYDALTKHMSAKVAPSARGKFHEVSSWIGDNLKQGVDASQWKEVVERELDAAVRSARREGHHSLVVALRELDSELNDLLPTFPGMPEAAAGKAAVDAGYRDMKVLEKAMTRAGPVNREGVMYPSDLAAAAQRKGHAEFADEAASAQGVFGSAPNAIDKLAHKAVGLGAAAGGIAAPTVALPAVAVSMLGTTELGRKFLLGQVPFQAFLQAHPELAVQIGRAIAQGQGQEQ